MFAGLWLDGLVRRDHEQNHIDPADARQHVAHKALMARHINKADLQELAIGRGEIEVGKPQIDGDPTPLLFFEPVGVDSRQRPHHRSLAMIDMSGGADDDRFHRYQCTERSSAPLATDVEGKVGTPAHPCENRGKPC